MSIGKRLKILRQNYGLSIADASNLLNIGFSTILRWEAEECLPNSENTQMLANLYGVSADWILTGDTVSSEFPKTDYLGSTDNEIKFLMLLSVLSPSGEQDFINYFKQLGANEVMLYDCRETT